MTEAEFKDPISDIIFFDRLSTRDKLQEQFDKAKELGLKTDFSIATPGRLEHNQDTGHDEWVATDLTEIVPPTNPVRQDELADIFDRLIKYGVESK